MQDVSNYEEKHSFKLQSFLTLKLSLNLEILLYILVILIAIGSRFYGLGDRVMSHDENTHVYFSWLLEQGRGYKHDPLSHGPFQFHLLAFSYFLFGDTDATARFPSAIFSVASIGLIWVFRRWLGRKGALLAALMMLISPYMLFYGRYARNEALVVLETLLSVWAVCSYMETRQTRWLYLLAISLSLHFATKESAFIFTALLLVFLGIHFLWQLMRAQWKSKTLQMGFILGLLLSVVGALSVYRSYQVETSLPGTEGTQALAPTVGGVSPLLMTAAIITIIGIGLVAYTLLSAFGRRLQQDFPSFDLLIVAGTMVLPQLAALPVTILGWDPLAYQDPIASRNTLIVVFALCAAAAIIGLLWDWQRWLTIAAIFFVPFLVLYTTVFTNKLGFQSGFVGSLGYWLKQHGVERGSQPKFYYAFLQIPLYEFLPAIGVLLAGFYTLRDRLFRKPVSNENQETQASPTAPFPFMLFTFYWALGSLLAYSIAGERMPWITVHIALPMILLAGWGFERLLNGLDWHALSRSQKWLIPSLLLVLLSSGVAASGFILFPASTSSTFLHGPGLGILLSLGAAIGSAVGLLLLSRGLSFGQLARATGILAFAALFALTARAAYRAAFINYDNAKEYLVYAHSGPGPKIALEQIEELSLRTTGGLDFRIAYDNEMLYPYWWYMRNYTNANYFGANPSRDLLNHYVVTAGDGNWDKIDPLLGDNFESTTLTRIWWPNQEYYAFSQERILADLPAQVAEEATGQSSDQSSITQAVRDFFRYIGGVWNRIKLILTDPDRRYAIWQIWLNRDYTAYGSVIGRDLSLANWDPANRMKLYIRKDIGSLVWTEGLAPTILEVEEYIDPYVDRLTNQSADMILSPGDASSASFNQPKSVAVAADGSLYVTDTMNHRIQHLSPEGEVLQIWGEFGSSDEGQIPPGGTFNQPWGVAVAPDGSVYVADTWNHRIQRFSPEGKFELAFGYFGQAETPDAFWGPRDIAIDAQGRLFISDTGNKRIVVFDSEGAPLGSFGGFGVTLGGFDEPVGLALDPQGRLYVADTWNQRIQVFEESSPNAFQPVGEWSIDGWFGQSLENKPFLAASSGVLCASDPDGFRILCFDPQGTFLQGWGMSGNSPNTFNLPTGVAFDDSCGLWVVDSNNNRLMKFALDLCEP